MSFYSITNQEALGSIDKPQEASYYSGLFSSHFLKKILILIQDICASCFLSWGSVQHSSSVDPTRIKELVRKGPVNHNAVLGYTQTLSKRTNRHFEILQGMTGSRITLPSQEELRSKGITFIPFCVVIKGIRNHIVGGGIDLSKNRLEFFDPKGATIADHKGSQLYHSDQALSLFIQGLLSTYGNEDTQIIQNTHRHQRDIHNCGIYVSNYIKRRFQDGETAEQIFANRIILKEANNDFRAHMIQEITDYYRS